MPWEIKKSGAEFKVVEAAGGKHPGKVFGTHPSHAAAAKQISALEANVKERAATQVPSELPTGNNQLTSRNFQMSDRFYRYERAESADDATKTIQVAFSSEYPVKRVAGKKEEKLGAARSGETYLELLSHDPTDADFSALNRAAPVLDEHDDAIQIGNVKRAQISKDKKGRAVLEFDGLTDLSNLRYEQLKRKKRMISVGYDHTQYLGEETLEDGRTAKRFAFAADEISTVARPADPTSGPKRSADEQSACLGCGDMFDDDALDDDCMCEDCRNANRAKAKKERAEKRASAAAAAAATPPVDSPPKLDDTHINAIKRMKLKIGNQEVEIGSQADLDTVLQRAMTDSTKATRDQLLQRRKSIREFADKFIEELPTKRAEIIALADKADGDDSVTPETFSRHMVFVEMPKLRASNPRTIDENELHDDIDRYDYQKAIRSAVEKNEKGAVPDGLEGEVHQEIVRRKIGCSPEGFWVPFGRSIKLNGKTIRCGQKVSERMTRGRLNRAPGDMQVGVFGQGGALVPTELQIPVIEILRNKMVTERLGVRTIAGLEGFIAWPRQIGACGPYFVPETFGLAVSNPQLDQLMGVPHRVGVTGAYSKQLILQSAIDPESFMREDQMRSLAVKMDAVTLLGAGANDEPTGIFNTIGIGSVNFAGVVTYQKVVNFKTQLALANAAASDMAYVTTPLVEEKWRTTPKVGTTFPIFIWEDGSWGDDTADGRVIGLRATATNQITNDRVGFGNFPDAQKLLWGGLDIVVNPFTRSKEAVVEITSNAWMDVMVRHQGSFAYSVDAGDQ